MQMNYDNIILNVKLYFLNKKHTRSLLFRYPFIATTCQDIKGFLISQI